jgi:hypothetical protein
VVSAVIEAVSEGADQNCSVSVLFEKPSMAQNSYDRFVRPLARQNDKFEAFVGNGLVKAAARAQQPKEHEL